MQLFQILSQMMGRSERHSPPGHQFITIADQVFAVAHSREEMARMMRMNDRKVTGYVLQNHM